MYLAATGKRRTPEKVVAAVQKGAEVREEKLAARRRPVPLEEQVRRATQKAAAAETDRQKAAKGYPGRPTKSANARAVKPPSSKRAAVGAVARPKARRATPHCGTAAPPRTWNASRTPGGSWPRADSGTVTVEQLHRVRDRLQVSGPV